MMLGATFCLNESYTFILYVSAEKQTFNLNTRWNRQNKLLIHQNKNFPLKYNIGFNQHQSGSVALNRPSALSDQESVSP